MRALLLGLLVASPAWAQKVGVPTFTGPGANPVRNQVVAEVCEVVDCVAQAKVSSGGRPDWKKAKKEGVKFFLTGKVSKRGKAKWIELQVLAKAGAPKWKKRAWLVQGLLGEKDLADAVASSLKAMGASGSKRPKDEGDEVKPVDEGDEKAPPVDEKKPPVDEKKPPADEKKPPADEKKPPADERSEDDKRLDGDETKSFGRPADPPPDENEVTPTPEPTEAVKQSALTLGVEFDVNSRNFSYQNLQGMNLRSYSAGVIATPTVKVELFPLALVNPTSFAAGLGVEAAFGLSVGLQSRRSGTTLPYPTTVSRLEFAAKWRIRPISTANAAVTPFLGFRSHRFVAGPASDGTRIDRLPNVMWQMIRIGVGGDLAIFNTGLHIDGRFAVNPIIGAGDLIGPNYFRQGSAFGIELGLGVAYAMPFLPALEVRLGFDFFRYGATFRTSMTDTFIADGAVDQYLGGGLQVRFKL